MLQTSARIPAAALMLDHTDSAATAHESVALKCCQSCTLMITVDGKFVQDHSSEWTSCTGTGYCCQLLQEKVAELEDEIRWHVQNGFCSRQLRKDAAHLERNRQLQGASESGRVGQAAPCNETHEV